jgi:hypothetical protein
MVNAVSHALNHAAGAAPVPGRDAVVLAAWAAAGLASAIALFHWERYRPAQPRAARVAS